MKRLHLVPAFVLAAVALMASTASAGSGPPPPTPTAVPEPSSVIVFGGLAALGLATWFWKRRTKHD